MYLYQLKQDRLYQIYEKPYKKEADIHELCENNLPTIFGLVFVKKEFSLHNFRIDTLAYDPKRNSFVIIEYKREKNYSVIDQGYAYLSLMLNNKADFILEYNENCSKNLKRNDVDWSQSRVIFIAPSFTNHQRESINFKNLPIELWEIKRYENETISFQQIKPNGSSESISTIANKNEQITIVTQEIKVYSEEDHTNDKPVEIVELYEKLKEMILNLGDNISISPTKLYIGFIVNKTNFTDILILKKSLKVWINLKTGELDDPKDLARNVSNIGHWGNGDYEIQMSDDENFEYIMSLVKQSYKRRYSQ